MMITLKDIDRKIRELIGDDDSGSRPFICDGSPIGCEVFLIGLNPAVYGSWWDCWDPEIGFDREKWIRRFKQEISSGKKIPGAKTRLNIEKLRNKIFPYRVMDLNLYHKRSDNLPQLPGPDRKTVFCDYLVENITPKLIFLHGYQVVKYFTKLARKDLNKMNFTAVEIFGNPTTIFRGSSHLSLYWFDSEIDETGERLSEWCGIHGLNKDE